MVLSKFPVPRRPSIWIIVGQGPTALSVGAGGVVWTFGYRLKYYRKGPLNPKRPTNQFIVYKDLY